MLEQLRTAAGTWVAKLLLIILGLAFATWGVSGKLTETAGGNTVVAAGDSTISATEFRLAYDLQLNTLSQRFGQQITREQAKALGIENQVLSHLVSSAVLDEQARKLTLGASDTQIFDVVSRNPSFFGSNGRYDSVQLDRVLNQFKLSRQDYWDMEKKTAIRQQVVQAVADGVETPDTFLHAVALYNGEDRTAEYLILPQSLVLPIDPPAEAALSTWFEERKKQYAAPEYRKISYVKLTPEDIADEGSISDTQVRADYDENKAQFTTPETRAVEQLIFPTKEAAEAAAASLKSGTTFEKVVEGQGKTMADVQLGTLSKAGVPDKAAAEAAFSLSLNQTSDVIDGTFGPIIVRVTAVNSEVVKSYEEAAAQIRKELALAEANRIILDVHDTYDDARAGGATLAEAAEKLRLRAVTVDAIDQGGKRPDDSLVSDLPESSDLLRAAFATEVGVENEAVNIGTDGFLFFEVQGITPTRERPLAEVKDKVIADWTKMEADKRMTDKIAEFEKRLKDGATLDAIATEVSLEKQTKRGIKRGAEDADFGADGVAEIFGVAEGGVGDFKSPSSDDRILFKVAEVFEPAASSANEVPENARRGYASGIADDVLDQLVAKLQSEYDVRVNQAAAESALAY